MNVLTRLRDGVQRFVQHIEARLQQSRSIIARLFYAVLLLGSYTVLSLFYAVFIVFLPAQESFTLVHPIDPNSGYNASYTQHRSFQRTAKVSALSSLVVVVVITILNGVFISHEKSFAADQRITSLSLAISDTSPGASATYTYTMEVAQQISQGTQLWLFFTDTHNQNPSSTGFDFSSATMTGNINGGFAVDQAAHAIASIQLNADLPAGTYTFVLSNMHNTTSSSSYMALVGSQGYSPLSGNNTQSSLFTIGTTNPEPNTGTGNGGVCSEQGTITNVVTHVFGTSVNMNWDEYTDAETYTVQWYKTEDPTDAHQQADITNLYYTLQNLDTNTSYSVRITANVSSCGEGATSERTVITTESKTVSAQLFSKPKVIKKAISTTTVKIKWKQKEGVSNHKVQLFDSTGKKLKTYSNITSAPYTLSGLQPGVKYSVRIKAVYLDGEETKFSQKTTFETSH